MPELEAIVCDYDGTLVNTLGLIHIAFKSLYDIGLSKREFKSEDELKHFISYEIDWENGASFRLNTYYKLLGIPDEDSENACAILEYVFRAKYKDVLEDDKTGRKLDFLQGDKKELLKLLKINALNFQISLFGGVEQTIKELKKGGMKIGIVSNNQGASIKHDLQKYNLLNCIDSIIGYEDVNNQKPDPEGLLKCINEMRISNPSKVLYIGDMIPDIITGKNAGAKTGCVTYGATLPDKVHELKKRGKLDFVIEKPEDMLNLI